MDGIVPTVARVSQWASSDEANRIASVLLQNWFLQFAIVTLLVWMTLKVIARVYSGDVQNTPLGPIALRAHDGEPEGHIQRVWAPKAILPSSMNGQHAYCKFLYAYDDAEGERQYVQLSAKETKARKKWRKQFLFEIRDRRYARSGEEFIGRETVDDVASRDIVLRNPDLTQETPPDTGPATPDAASDWIAAQSPRDFQISGTEIISIPDGLRASLANARETFVQEKAKKVAKRRSALVKLGDDARHRPGVIGYYYMKVSFETSTWFVLFHHPDRDLKMTAWLTVLTSFFGFLLGKLP